MKSESVKHKTKKEEEIQPNKQKKTEEGEGKKTRTK